MHARVRADAVQLAEQAGFSVNAYEREVVFTRKHWASTAGGLGTINNRTAAVSSVGRYLTMHELGHSLGWRHANFWHVPVLNANPLSPDGSSVEYGDGFDLMGHSGGSVCRSSPVLMQRAGWLPDENVLTVTATGTYTLQSLAALPQPGPVIDRFTSLKIPRDS